MASVLVVYGGSGRGSTSEGRPLLYPLGGDMFVHMSARYRKHRLFGVVGIGRVGIPPSVVEVHKDDQRGPSSTLVPVRQRMVTDEAVAQLPSKRDPGNTPRLRRPPSERVKRNRRVRSALAALVSLRERHVTCSASQRYSARSRYLVTWPNGLGVLGLSSAAGGHAM